MKIERNRTQRLINFIPQVGSMAGRIVRQHYENTSTIIPTTLTLGTVAANATGLGAIIRATNGLNSPGNVQMGAYSILFGGITLGIAAYVCDLTTVLYNERPTQYLNVCFGFGSLAQGLGFMAGLVATVSELGKNDEISQLGICVMAVQAAYLIPVILHIALISPYLEERESRLNSVFT